jgi:NAD(P)H-dependent FMN reductase
MTTLLVMVGSTRPGRVGTSVADWFVDRAKHHSGFDLDVVDLAELDLPFLDEPAHPKLQRYEHDHTRAWSERVDAADAVVHVSPEYNTGCSAPLSSSSFATNGMFTAGITGTICSTATICTSCSIARVPAETPP